MFTSFADVFRTRQAVRDLLEIVQTHRSAVNRLGASVTDRADIVAITESGCVIADSAARAYSSILFAAAMPDDDFSTFIVATTILLADRLQGGAGEDDLYWNYDAFRDHYLLAGPQERAALMNGFRVAHDNGQVQLPDSPPPDVCLTHKMEDILQLLESDQQEGLAETLRSDPSAETAGALWVEASAGDLTFARTAGFRFLYERPSSMSPENPTEAPLLPWA